MGQTEKSAPLKEKENVSRTKTVFSLLHFRQGRRKADSKNRSSNIGQVISVSNPQQKYPSYMPGQTPTLETTVDVKVQVEDQQVNFEKLPSTAQIVNFGNEGVVVSDSREAMCAEIDAMLRHSKGVVESVDYHNGVISSCEEMLTRINPQIAKDKQQEKDINNLKSEVSGMKGTLSNIESMLSKALSGNNFKK